MYGKCRTVSWNAIILNNINDNIVNSYRLLDVLLYNTGIYLDEYTA